MNDIPATRFQSFEERGDPSAVAARIKELRSAMKARKFDGYLVPRADVHRGESVPPSEARLAWLTGFTGSAGIALISTRSAHLFVDGRYALQAPAQTDTNVVTCHTINPANLAEAIAAETRNLKRIGYDPWLHTPGEIKSLQDAFGKDAKFVPGPSLVDPIWTDRPAPPDAKGEILGANRTGKKTEDKLNDLRQTLRDAKAGAVVLTLPESICWLFNIRGRDVPNTPFVLGFAIVPARGKPALFVPKAKFTASEQQRLGKLASLKDPKAFEAELKKFGAAGKAVWIDPASAPIAVATALKSAGAGLIEKRDPVLLPKAMKNEAEIAGMREAHKYDGVAMAKFLHWLDKEAPKGGLTEIDITAQLEAFRREGETLVDISFETIAGAGPHGAIMHYRVTENSNRHLKPGELMLVDSGGQYLSGTTDITRTMFTGKASREQKDRFTRVLKGMIALSMARFPKGTTGVQLDTLARNALWQVGENFAHGTGHGVGAFLAVHEGPASISPRGTVPLRKA
jgi:Xaa-Pro aminopeptidase